MAVGRCVLVCVWMLAGAVPAGAQTVAVGTVAEAVQQASAPRPPRLKGFSAVLLTGEMEPAQGSRSGTPAEAEIPAAAKGALASITSFLPYKVYRLADAAVVSGTGNVQTLVLLRDPEMANLGWFRLSLAPHVVGTSAWTVGVVLNNTLNAEKDPGREIIRTTVSMTPGETVVVGTSPAGGGRKAYILLLTSLVDK